MSLQNSLIKLAYEHPDLREDLVPLLLKEAASSPYEEAYNLIQNDRDLTRQLDNMSSKVGKALKTAQGQLKQLEKAGSEKLSAPSVLAGQPLDELKSLQSFVNRIVSQVESLEKHGR